MSRANMAGAVVTRRYGATGDGVRKDSETIAVQQKWFTIGVVGSIGACRPGAGAADRPLLSDLAITAVAHTTARVARPGGRRAGVVLPVVIARGRSADHFFTSFSQAA